MKPMVKGHYYGNKSVFGPYNGYDFQVPNREESPLVKSNGGLCLKLKTCTRQLHSSCPGYAWPLLVFIILITSNLFVSHMAHHTVFPEAINSIVRSAMKASEITTLPVLAEKGSSESLAETTDDPAPDDVKVPSREPPAPTFGFPHSYSIQTKQDEEDYAACSGVYTRQDSRGAMNGKPVYINEEKDRFLGYTGSVWEISGLAYMQELEKHHDANGFWPGTFGGFHAGGGDLPDTGDGWGSYTVTPTWDP